jgi:hypothetical protein
MQVVAALVGAVTIAATPISRAEGWTFTWKVTESSDPRAAQPSVSVQMIPGKMRWTFLSPPQGMPAKGYMLLDADKASMAMLNPEDKTALTMDASDLGTGMGAIGSFVKMDVSDSKFSVEGLGAGERLLGRATQKYRVTRSYRMTMQVFGKKLSSQHESVTDLWVSNEIPMDKSWEAWTDRFSRGAARVGGDAARKLMEAEKDYPKGIALKYVMDATETDDKGKVTKTRTAMEMTELKRANLDASLFEIPADYTVTDMKQVVAETGKAMEQAKKDCEKEHGKNAAACDPSQLNVDSLVAAARQGAMEGLKEGVKEAAKESAKDAVKRGILGKFKKPGGE